jgi:hypothetical protein
MRREVEKVITDSEIGRIRLSFDQYLKDGQKALIAGYSRHELEFVLLHEIKQIEERKDTIPRYMAIKNRVDELKEEEVQRRTTKEKWIDRIVGFLLGVISGYLILLLTK